MNFEDARYRKRLARHFVQRQWVDFVSGERDENRAFPKHETTESPNRLSRAHLDFQEAVLAYCFGAVSRAATGLRERRLAFWGTLALMRCVGSSPAAALSALRNRMSNESDRLEPQICAEDSDDEDADLGRHMQEAVQSLRICLAADESIRSGQVVALQGGCAAATNRGDVFLPESRQLLRRPDRRKGQDHVA